MVPGVHRAQRLEEALLQVRGVEVQELRGARRQGEPRRPRAAPRGLGQRAPGRREKEEAGGKEVVRARRPWREGRIDGVDRSPTQAREEAGAQARGQIAGEEEDRACAAHTFVAARRS